MHTKSAHNGETHAIIRVIHGQHRGKSSGFESE